MVKFKDLRISEFKDLGFQNLRISGFENLGRRHGDGRRECAAREVARIFESSNQQILKSLNSEILKFKDSACV